CFVYRYLKEKYYEIKYIDFDDNSVDFQYIPKDSPRLNRDAYLLLENGNYQYYNRASVINDNLVLYVIDMIEIRVEILNSDEFFEMEITPIFAYSMIHGEVLERYSNVSILSIQDNEGNIIDQSDFNKYIYLTVIVETKSV
ncbi:MAG: hypothetical protein RBQ97_07010, partial [Acholeplasma sp.]|nr:hypothetical protein [Acholeplasma sp.]